MLIKHFLRTPATVASMVLCASSFLSCSVMNGTTGEVLQTVLSSSDPEFKMAPQYNDNKEYNIDMQQKMKEAGKEKERLDMQSLKKY